jgi:hypothetical protein
MLGLRLHETKKSPLQIYRQLIKYRDSHTIKELRKKRSRTEWIDCIGDWRLKLQTAKQEMSDLDSEPDVDSDEMEKYNQFTTVHIFAMTKLIKALEIGHLEPPKASKSRQDLLADLWLAAYSANERFVPLGSCALTAVLDVESNM